MLEPEMRQAGESADMHGQPVLPGAFFPESLDARAHAGDVRRHIDGLHLPNRGQRRRRPDALLQ